MNFFKIDGQIIQQLRFLYGKLDDGIHAAHPLLALVLCLRLFRYYIFYVTASVQIHYPLSASLIPFLPQHTGHSHILIDHQHLHRF